MTGRACLRWIVLGMLMFGLAATSAGAKGVTRRLVVSGSTLVDPIEITDPAALANVWGGEFIAAPTSEPDRMWPRYEVAFYVQPPRTDGVRMMYVVRYVRDSKAGAGFVYLPGRGEHWYRLNVSTILRGSEGEWHRATPSWSKAVNGRLP